MSLLEELTEQILDHAYGACRDINFERLNWNGAVAVLKSLLHESSSATATDGDGRTLDVAGAGAIGICKHARDTSACRLILTNVSELFQRLQVFVCAEEDGAPFVELTFFPDELLTHSFTTEKLIDKLNYLATVGCADNFYLRYENASWDFGSTGYGTGVITTWHAIRSTS